MLITKKELYKILDANFEESTNYLTNKINKVERGVSNKLIKLMDYLGVEFVVEKSLKTSKTAFGTVDYINKELKIQPKKVLKTNRVERGSTNKKK